MIANVVQINTLARYGCNIPEDLFVNAMHYGQNKVNMGLTCHRRYGTRREKTCLRGFAKTQVQTSLHICAD